MNAHQIDGQLVRYDAMCRAIDTAYDFDELKDIRDKAAMLEAAARVAKNVEAEDRCYYIRRRAEAKVGQLLSQMEKAKGGAEPGIGRGGAKNAVPSENRIPPPTLAELGITKKQSSEFQQLAAVPKKEFEAAFAEGGKPSVAEITGKKKVERSPEWNGALWVWGRVLDFERNDILKLSPRDCVKELDEHQVEQIAKLGPKIISWLERAVKCATKESSDG